jgi:hypothetical protein
MGGTGASTGKSRLYHDRCIRRVGELDGVRATLSTEAVALDRDLNSEALQINDGGEDNDSCNQVHDIRKTFSPERLTQGQSLVVSCEEELDRAK